MLIQLSQFDKSAALEEARLLSAITLICRQPRFPHVDARYPTERRGAERVGGKLDSVADPRPGQSIQTGEPEYVIPDVLVRKHNVADGEF
ncbi:hypothetical protein KCP74_08625 [Salmonella enterica subsp. enterica]|nr:hypothetical protein KCP74_08625 [Salmonella enterica subsp. enterica]